MTQIGQKLTFGRRAARPRALPTDRHGNRARNKEPADRVSRLAVVGGCDGSTDAMIAGNLHLSSFNSANHMPHVSSAITEASVLARCLLITRCSGLKATEACHESL